MEKVGGVLVVGRNDQYEVVLNHPDLKPDADGVGHIVFSPHQARNLARLLRRHASACLVESVGGSSSDAGLEFDEFQSMNLQRCEEAFHRSDDWTPFDWALAIAGEAGELCNILKKVRRGDFTLDAKRAEILSEIADVMTYCDLLMSRLDASTGREILRKFDEVSKRVGFERA